MDARDRATELLNRLGAGETAAQEELLALLYDELKKLAADHMARERSDHTLQPTALTHEAWIRLLDGGAGASFESRRQFYALASKVMRSVLVDHARKKKADKRGGGAARVSLEAGEGAEVDRPLADPVMMLDLDEALTALGRADEGLARAVELRYFGGLSVADVAEALSLPLRTAERRLRVATIWLKDHLAREREPE